MNLLNYRFCSAWATALGGWPAPYYIGGRLQLAGIEQVVNVCGRGLSSLSSSQTAGPLAWLASWRGKGRKGEPGALYVWGRPACTEHGWYIWHWTVATNGGSGSSLCSGCEEVHREWSTRALVIESANCSIRCQQSYAMKTQYNLSDQA